VNVIVMGGDIQGKLMIPIIKETAMESPRHRAGTRGASWSQEELKP
jgi:hypothetical protein